ncbi:Gti1/Pac2 family-domain-containing protein [Abortiporus biennis]|nr:Gti1/Pac2 family-domain-containing protein [Abortiporus biennis]
MSYTHSPPHNYNPTRLVSNNAMVQKPTCVGVRIRTVDEANQLFHAVYLGKAPLFTRRLTVAERRAIHTGCAFVWEERNPSVEASGDGIERWTDGRRWSCSRVKNDFLFYQEKLPEISDEIITAAMHQNRLVKQTYSVYVETMHGRRKWHLVAYYTPDTIENLMCINDIPELSGVQVPRGAYKAARLTRGRSRQEHSVTPFPSSSSSSSSTHYNYNYPTYPENPFEQGTPTQTRAYEPDTPEEVPSLIHSSSVASTPTPPSSPPSDFSVPHLSPGPTPEHLKLIMESGISTCLTLTEAGSHRLEAERTTVMAPLVYIRKSPYQPRHPLDNDALRMLDADQWMKPW